MPPLNIASCHTILSWDSDMVSPPEARPWSLDSDPDPELDNESHRLVSGSKQVRAHFSQVGSRLGDATGTKKQELAIRAGEINI